MQGKIYCLRDRGHGVLMGRNKFNKPVKDVVIINEIKKEKMFA